MKIILLIVFIFLIVFLLSILPIPVNFGSHLNVIENKGFYSLKITFLKVLCGRVRIENGKLEFENNNDLIFKSNSDEKFINSVFINIIKMMNVNETQIFIEYGNKKNAANTAMVCGILQSSFSAFYVMLKSRYKNVYQFLDIDPNYNKDTLEVTACVNVSISFLQIMICLVKAKIKQKKEVVNNE